MKFVTIRLPRRSEAEAGAIRVTTRSLAQNSKKIPELWFPLPLEVCMKTIHWLTRNRLLSHLRFATAPLLTCLAALFISVTTPAAASGPSANPDAPRSTFVTSTPKAPPQVRYMLIELGGRTVFDISQSGQIVGNKQFAPGLRHAAFWPSSRSAAIDLGTLPGLDSVARALTLGAR